MSFSEKMRESLGAEGVRLEITLPDDSLRAGSSVRTELTMIGGTKSARVEALVVRIIEADRHWRSEDGERVDEADALALMDLVLTDAYEGQLTWGVYLATLQNEAARAATWEKFKTDFEQVIAKTPEIRKPQTARLVSYFCTSDEIDDVIAFVETQASLIPGYERRLAQASETARLCAAFRAEKGTELAAALEAL